MASSIFCVMGRIHRVADAPSQMTVCWTYDERIEDGLYSYLGIASIQERMQMWRYDLPEDWLSGTPDRLRSVVLDDALAARTSHVRLDELLLVVVGDATVIEPGLSEQGFTVIRVDAEGVPVAE